MSLRLTTLVFLFLVAACGKPGEMPVKLEETSVIPEVTSVKPEVTSVKPEVTSVKPDPAAPAGSAALHPAAPAQHAVAFYEAVPFAKGVVKAAQFPISIDVQGEKITAIGMPASYWPDGSVQWLRVEGVAPEGIAAIRPLAIAPGSFASKPSRPPESRVEALGDTVVWTHAASGEQIVLKPEASLLRISKPKPEPLTDPEWLDREGQYAWAVPLSELAEGDQPIPLKLRIRDQAVETETPLYRVVRFRGDGGAARPGNGLEWQLRVKVYHDLPLIRTEMTWLAQWDVTQYALVSAKWTLENNGRWNAFATADGTASPGVLIQNDHRGGGSISREEGAAVSEEDPSPIRDTLVALSPKGGALAVGVPQLSRLGPNHLSGDRQRLEIAGWSEHSGRALDLRRSTTREDYGMSGMDMKWNGRGVSRTLYSSLALCSGPAEAAALARHEAARDYLWFADADALGRSQALGPYSASVVARNPEVFSAMQANLHFLRASRDRWRWNGWANFGDLRTNFAKGDVPNRGLYAGRWALSGRYGWRNTSGTISKSFLQTGMLLNDRALILAGLDNAEHIIDVDAFHGSFFSENKGDQGGMRRRNRDHWSGSVQAQYSPCSGLYLAQWLTGNGRAGDTLHGLRGYASRKDPGNSVFPAAAWLYHYQATHDPASLAEATRLLDLSAAWWKNHDNNPLDGLAALYAGNFRRVSDGMSTLIAFHHATGDPRYLRGIEESLRAHPLSPKGDESAALFRLYELAYLRSQGVTGLDEDPIARECLARCTPAGFPVSAEIRKADYSLLCELITTKIPPAGHPMYRESASIAGRSAAFPILLEQFGRQAVPTPQP